MKAQDFQLDEQGDLLFLNGDVVVSESDSQHIEDLITAHKGWYKEFPFLGVGLTDYLKSSGMQLELKMMIQQQLQADGFMVNQIEIGDLEKMEIYIDATRNI